MQTGINWLGQGCLMRLQSVLHDLKLNIFLTEEITMNCQKSRERSSLHQESKSRYKSSLHLNRQAALKFALKSNRQAAVKFELKSKKEAEVKFAFNSKQQARSSLCSVLTGRLNPVYMRIRKGTHVQYGPKSANIQSLKMQLAYFQSHPQSTV